MGILSRGDLGHRRAHADRQLPRLAEGGRPALRRARADAAARRAARCAATRRHAPTRRAERRDRARRPRRAAYGERVALRDVTLRCPAGRDARGLRPQRRRQDDAAAHPRDAAAPARRRARACSGASCRARAGRCAGGSACSPTSRCSTATSPRARTCASTRACTASRPRGWRSCSSAVGLARARRRAGAHALARDGRSASRSAARCCTSPSCCCSTSRWPTSTRRAAELVEPLIGPRSGRTRVLITHDLAAGLAEADLVLGLRGGRPALLAAGGRREAGDVRDAVP